MNNNTERREIMAVEAESKKIRKLFYFEQVEPMFTRGRRDWSVDILRCFSCFMVCAIHAANLTYVRDIGCAGSNPWLHHEIYRMIFASPTVLFVMVSGIFFLAPERKVRAPKVWKKNVVKMGFTYIFWCLMYALYRIYIMDPRPEFTWELLYKEWLVQPAHLWYIPMIIGLYIICPILRPIVATYDRRLFVYITCLFIGGLLLWTIYYWTTDVNPTGEVEELTTRQIIISHTPMGLLCQFPMWMLFGWIAYTYRPTRPLRVAIYIFAVLVILFGMYEAINIGIVYEDHFVTALTQKFSIFIFVKNTAIFYFIISVFRDHKFSSVGQAILRRMSDDTLIIYLVHYMILYILYDNNVLYNMGLTPWIGVWAYSFIAYFAGGIIASLFHLIWNPIQKTLFARMRRSKRIYAKIERNEKKENRVKN